MNKSKREPKGIENSCEAIYTFPPYPPLSSARILTLWLAAPTPKSFFPFHFYIFSFFFFPVIGLSQIQPITFLGASRLFPKRLIPFSTCFPFPFSLFFFFPLSSLFLDLSLSSSLFHHSVIYSNPLALSPLVQSSLGRMARRKKPQRNEEKRKEEGKRAQKERREKERERSSKRKKKERERGGGECFILWSFGSMDRIKKNEKTNSSRKKVLSLIFQSSCTFRSIPQEGFPPLPLPSFPSRQAAPRRSSLSPSPFSAWGESWEYLASFPWSRFQKYFLGRDDRDRGRLSAFQALFLGESSLEAFLKLLWWWSNMNLIINASIPKRRKSERVFSFFLSLSSPSQLSHFFLWVIKMMLVRLNKGKTTCSGFFSIISWKGISFNPPMYPEW